MKLEMEDDDLNLNGYVVGGKGRRHRQQEAPIFNDDLDTNDFVFDSRHDFKFHQEAAEKRSWFSRLADSWFLMAIGAMLSFASANLLINEISPLGIDAIDYYNTGALLFCTVYLMARLRFPIKRAQLRGTTTSEGMLQIGITEYRDLFYKRSGEFDSRIVVLIVMASFLTVAMFLSVSFTYALADQAGLNIGLA